MRRKLFWLPLALACLVGCGPSAGTAKKEDTTAQNQDVTAEFRPLVEKVLAAWVTFDPSKPAEYYAKDPGLAFFDVAPLKYRGWQEYEEGWAKVIKDWKSMNVALNPDFKAARLGNVVWATSTMHFGIEPRKGAVMNGDGRMTQIWERRGDNWLIVHEHISMPMEPPAAPSAN